MSQPSRVIAAVLYGVVHRLLFGRLFQLGSLSLLVPIHAVEVTIINRIILSIYSWSCVYWISGFAV
ncbi:hypothetical protein EDB82DRAFT_516057 [Fusarium venenatum]|uniref:uncharacterized protein n=1 Tax=Fusarium venenatum TaxID=56646 RepID=UPI001DC39901|nr:hypothetical protein EDB82DRAFT_516057 [Fusarium venenatum]